MKTKIIMQLVLVVITLESSIDVRAQLPEMVQVESSLRSDVVRQGEALWELRARMEHYNTPGLSIAVIKDNKLHWAKAYGLIEAHKAKVPTTSTAFQAASISKLVNAIGIMKLVEEGQLDLDKDIHNYLKSWKLPASTTYPNVVITTRMLLAHVAGLSTHGFRGYKSSADLPSAVEILNKSPGVNSGKVRIIKKPNDSFQYSGGGTVITQVMIEDITGMSYEEYMQQKVLRPLGMNSSFYSVNQKGKEPRLATAHNYRGKPLSTKYHHYPESAPAGLWTTPTDLSKLMIDLMLSFKGDEGRLLQPSTALAMLEAPINGENNALGLFRTQKGDQLYFGHNGSNEGFKAQLIGSVDNGVGVVIMTNGEQFDITEETTNAVAQVYKWSGWFTADHLISDDFIVDKSLWKAYKGIYAQVDDSNKKLEIKTKGEKLRIKRAGAWELELIPIDNNKYMAKGADPLVTLEFRANGEMYVTQGETIIFKKQ